jgi:transcription elongation factor GreA
LATAKVRALAPDVTTTLDPQELRSRVASILERISARMIRRMTALSNLASDEDVSADATVRALQVQVGGLGQLAAGLAIVDAGCLPVRGAGYGSLVHVQDVESGEVTKYMLMVGSLVDIDADQVSLASPIGQALIGREPGEVITIETPQRQVRLRVIGLKTIVEALDEHEQDGRLEPTPAA